MPLPVLKAYVAQSIVYAGTIGGTVNDQCIAQMYGLVFEVNTPIVDGTGTAITFTGMDQVMVTDTALTIKQKLQAAFRANFNTITGRTDGVLIVFVWL